MANVRPPTYVAFEVSRGTGYVGKVQDDGTYTSIATCKDLDAAKELADVLNDREDLLHRRD